MKEKNVGFEMDLAVDEIIQDLLNSMEVCGFEMKT